ncbi:MAG: hypothetical protein ACK4OK_10000, partial [Thermoflexus sp.]
MQGEARYAFVMSREPRGEIKGHSPPRDFRNIQPTRRDHTTRSMEIREVEAEIWMAFLEGHAEAHVLQTAPWGDFKAGFGWQDRR